MHQVGQVDRDWQLPTKGHSVQTEPSHQDVAKGPLCPHSPQHKSLGRVAVSTPVHSVHPSSLVDANASREAVYVTGQAVSCKLNQGVK